MRRVLAILLLALLPLQFSWAAVASYCGHEEQVGATHFGHHEHQHPAGSSSNAEPFAVPDAPEDAPGDQPLGATDPDCGHCHGYCGVMLMVPPGLPGTTLTAHPNASLDEAGGAHAPTRPERPQWLPLA
jgi:hypothetical protein